MSTDERRTMFDQDAELYDRARPGYPAELFTDLAAIALIGPGSRVLEIGPGTGQATASVLALGAEVLAVELGQALAGVLARKLSGRSLHVIVGALRTASFRPIRSTRASRSQPGIGSTRMCARARPRRRFARVAPWRR